MQTNTRKGNEWKAIVHISQACDSLNMHQRSEVL